MTDLTSAQAAQQNNRDPKGRYSQKVHSASSVTLEDAAAVASANFATAADKWHTVNTEASRAHLDAVRAEVNAVYPNTKYIVFQASDQGDYTSIYGACDENGDPAEDRDGNVFNADYVEAAEDYANFLRFDSQVGWDEQVVSTDDLPDKLSWTVRDDLVVIDSTTSHEEDPDVAMSNADAARVRWDKANDDVNEKVVASVRASIDAAFPDAAYIAFDASDQGDYAYVSAVFNEDGDRLDDDDLGRVEEGDQDAASWLSVDNPHAWEKFHVNTSKVTDGEYVIGVHGPE